MTRIRTKHFEVLHRHASQHAPKWVKCWDSAVNDKQRTVLILQAANMAPAASRGKIAAVVAGLWAQQARKAHIRALRWS